MFRWAAETDLRGGGGSGPGGQGGQERPAAQQRIPRAGGGSEEEGGAEDDGRVEDGREGGRGQGASVLHVYHGTEAGEEAGTVEETIIETDGNQALSQPKEEEGILEARLYISNYCERKRFIRIREIVPGHSREDCRLNQEECILGLDQ